MLNLLKIYLIIGVIYVIIELILKLAATALGQKRFFESETTEDIVCESIAFLLEIFIWPWQLIQCIREVIMILKSGVFKEILHEIRETVEKED